jgi:hypothetical protein
MQIWRNYDRDFLQARRSKQRGYVSDSLNFVRKTGVFSSFLPHRIGDFSRGLLFQFVAA